MVLLIVISLEGLGVLCTGICAEAFLSEATVKEFVEVSSIVGTAAQLEVCRVLEDLLSLRSDEG